MVTRKNRLATDALREIRNTFSRFLSILVLSALAVAFLAGLRATAPDMQYTADNYYDRANMMDGYVLSTLGLTGADLTALAAADGVSAVEGGYDLDVVAVDRVVSLRSMPRDMNLPEVIRGRLPQQSNECITEELLLVELGLDVGDQITFTTQEDSLRRTVYTVVGTVNSPLYVGPDRGTSSLGSGAVDAFAYVGAENFDMDVFTVAYFTGTGLRELNSNEDEYEQRVEQLVDSLESLAEQRAQLRYDSVVGEAQGEIDDALAELADARAEVEQELADAEKELADGRAELDDGWAEYRDGLATLEQELTDAKKELADARVELDDGWDAYYDGVETLKQELAEAEQDLAEARAELDKGWADYNDGLAALEKELAEARATLEEAAATLEESQAALDLGKPDYELGLASYQANLDLLDQRQLEVSQGYAQYEAQLAPYVETPYYDYAVAQAAAEKALLDAAQQELDAGYAQLAAVKDRLDAAALQMAEGQAAIDAGWAEYNSGIAALEQEESTARAQLEEARAQLEQGESDYADGRASYEQGKQEGEQSLADALRDLKQGETDYTDGLATLEQEETDARAELADALADLQQGEEEYADGLAEYEQGKLEAEQELADAEAEIADAQAEVEKIEPCEWYVLSRYTNSGFVGYAQDSDRISNLAKVFPVIFFLVAALACLTTMTRMVDEQRTQIGALKAMGFSRLAISKKYIGYALLASLVGGLLGLAVGCTLIPLVIANAFNIMYFMPALEFKSMPGTYVISVLAAVVCTTGAALWACLSTLIATPATLMRPRAPKPGRRVLLERIKPVWSRLSFTWKVTVRNLLRYQRRFWMTVIGIAGCTALIVTGFGLHDSIFSILDCQFDEISTYDATLGLDKEATSEQLSAVEQALEDSPYVEKYMACSQTMVDASAQGTSYAAYLFAVEREDVEQFKTFVDLRHRQDEQPVTISPGGVVITEKLSELLGLSVGDTITLEGERRVEAAVTDITEQYVAHYVYLDTDLYLELFGEQPEGRVLLVDYAPGTGEAQSNELSAGLMKLDGVGSYSYIGTVRESFTDSMSAVNYAVIIITLAAAALAFVVLYNLTNINITERSRELATLKVLGFHDGETSAYVYRENIFLTLFGILLGLVLGKFLHGWMILTVEVEQVMFGRTAPDYAYVLAAALTVLFSVLVNVAAHFRLKKVDMVESLKTVE